MNNSHTDILLNNILSDAGNFSLVIFGFSATLFTVLYSFIIGRREQLKEISDRIKNGEKDILLTQRKTNAVTYINSLRNLNRHLIVSLFLSLGNYIATIISKYIQFDSEIKILLIIIFSTLGIGILIHIIFLLIKTVRKYRKSTKV
ncbi:hypothetical protein [Autumnicola edwardsiae]|uniref:DUF2721 domain-containing protein n=1 Tax=Autumnicola edwardsiae TaxID=3075594 RepID=A0ABU3CZ68_9FLAO|nr:hypothetical protein [Zunongwangia sp. F297]MDT0651553.1 hypothetical protein [Zunongwangia sp. F297]